MSGLKPKAQRLPKWMRRPISTDEKYPDVSKLLADLNLNTVCASANCPNRHECWNSGTATVMILGDVCTRNCRFCAVTTGTGLPPDPGEPARVAEAAQKLGLKHVVITSVTRDDLPDGGAGAFAETIRAVRAVNPGVVIEVLTPDFLEHLDTVLDAEPAIFNHNLETVKRLQETIRPQASYEQSLATLRKAAERGGVQVKSGLMLGLGETDDEVFEALDDLFAAGVRLLTLGQYLAPTREHHPVERFISPDHFDKLAVRAQGVGFTGVAAGPLVRSSYRADQLAEAAKGL
ncbi:MAG: lipoyl synthase [Verrucomicrobia bacterium]|nr:lipoyl synthase [Verrucomicrobiota bacterium]